MKQWWHASKGNKVFHLTLFSALLALVLDQITKWWIVYSVRLPEKGSIDLSPIFDLTYVENRGVSFGLFSGGMGPRIIFTLLAVVVAGFIIQWTGTLKRKVAAIGGGLIIGGALGNAIDRVAYGYVVDFLDFRGLWFPWQFNVADTFINIGVLLLVIDAFFIMPKLNKQAAVVPAADDAALSASASTEDADPKNDEENVSESKAD